MTVSALTGAGTTDRTMIPKPSTRPPKKLETPTFPSWFAMVIAPSTRLPMTVVIRPTRAPSPR